MTFTLTTVTIGWTLGVVYRPPWTGMGSQWSVTFWFFRWAIRFANRR